MKKIIKWLKFWFGPWSKHKPVLAHIWGPGNIVLEGDSNVAYMKPWFVSKDAFNVAKGGDVPQDVINQFPELLKRHQENPIKKAYIQIGGNLAFKCMDILIRDLKEIIKLYKKILPGEDIIIASLPFVDPKLGLNSWFEDVYNIHIELLCKNEEVKYLDIYTPLKWMWNKHGKKEWFDQVHYGYKCQKIIAFKTKAMWGIL